MCHYVVGSSCHDTSCLSMQKHLDNKQVSCCALSSQLFRLAAVSVDRNALNCCHETWWNLIGEPLGIWSIMATIRWCPIYPKWDSYQPLENEPALSGNPFLPMILTHTRHTLPGLSRREAGPALPKGRSPPSFSSGGKSCECWRKTEKFQTWNMWI
jgi:hypothetical protein